MLFYQRDAGFRAPVVQLNSDLSVRYPHAARVQDQCPAGEILRYDQNGLPN